MTTIIILLIIACIVAMVVVVALVVKAPVFDEDAVDAYVRSSNRAISEAQEVSRQYKIFKNGGKLV